MLESGNIPNFFEDDGYWVPVNEGLLRRSFAEVNRPVRDNFHGITPNGQIDGHKHFRSFNRRHRDLSADPTVYLDIFAVIANCAALG